MSVANDTVMAVPAASDTLVMGEGLAMVTAGYARVGWGNTLGTVMRLLLNLAPSTRGSPITDMTTVTAVSLQVTRGDGQTVETWSCSVVGSPIPLLAVWAHTYQPTDLVAVETLTIIALMTTTAGIVPSEAFEVYVGA